MVLKKVVEEAAFFAFRKAQFDAMNTERLGKIHVSDIIKPCQRYNFYKRKYSGGLNTTDIKALFFGQAVHAVTNMSTDPKHNELFLAYDFMIGEPVTYEEAKKIPQDDERQFDILYGSIDDILNIGGELVICDKKTTGSLDYFKRHSANDGHQKQINIYAWLAKECYGIEATKGCNIYFDNKVDPLNRIDVVPKAYPLDDFDVTKAETLRACEIVRHFLVDKYLPDPTFCFLCNGMCPYIDKCVRNEE